MKNNTTNPQLSQLSYINRTVPFMLEKTAKTLSNSFHKTVRRNCCKCLFWPGGLKQTLNMIPQQRSEKSLNKLQQNFLGLSTA